MMRPTVDHNRSLSRQLARGAGSRMAIAVSTSVHREVVADGPTREQQFGHVIRDGVELWCAHQIG